ncbi:hypothetical protein BKA69DRAFT_1054546, partial [Paraphysoderma sedebokerense]
STPLICFFVITLGRFNFVLCKLEGDRSPDCSLTSSGEVTLSDRTSMAVSASSNLYGVLKLSIGENFGRCMVILFLAVEYLYDVKEVESRLCDSG